MHDWYSHSHDIEFWTSLMLALPQNPLQISIAKTPLFIRLVTGHGRKVPVAIRKTLSLVWFQFFFPQMAAPHCAATCHGRVEAVFFTYMFRYVQCGPPSLSYCNWVRHASICIGEWAQLYATIINYPDPPHARLRVVCYSRTFSKWLHIRWGPARDSQWPWDVCSRVNPILSHTCGAIIFTTSM